MFRMSLVPVALAALVLAMPATRAAAQAQSAYAEAVGACVAIIETGASPDPLFTAARLSPQPTHEALKRFFYPDATDTRWYLRPLDQGAVRAVTSDSDRSCTVFLFGVQGTAINLQVSGRFSGWTRQDIDGAGVAYSRRNPKGELVVASVHDGPPTVKSEQIGAMLKVYILRR